MSKVAYVAMSADLVHPGHLNIIKEAAKYGRVVVGVLTDEAIVSYKRLPFMKFSERAQIVSQLKNVEEVISQETLSYADNLRKLKPDFVIHGDDWREGVQRATREECIRILAEWGGEVIDIPYTAGISSTSLNKALKTIGSMPDVRRSRLRRLLNTKPLLRVMQAHNGLSGLIIENMDAYRNKDKVEFDAMWASSLTDSTTRGKPDIEAVNIDNRLHSINDILECTTKPIIYDADTGGIAEHFVYTVRTLERHGISATIIEDKIGLKKNSLLGNDVKQSQDSIENFCHKIRAGKKAQVSDDFMIIARIESLILEAGQEDAIRRARAYIDAGADGIMIHSRQKDGKEVFAFCKEYNKFPNRKPLVVVPTTYNTITDHELAENGANIIIYANHMLRSAYPAMVDTAKTILEHGRAKEIEPNCISIKEILKLIPGTI